MTLLQLVLLLCVVKYFFVLVKGREVLPLVDASVVKDVRKELTLIRDKVNSLLDALDITDKVPSKHPSNQQHQSSSGEEKTLMNDHPSLLRNTEGVVKFWLLLIRLLSLVSIFENRISTNVAWDLYKYRILINSSSNYLSCDAANFKMLFWNRVGGCCNFKMCPIWNSL